MVASDPMRSSFLDTVWIIMSPHPVAVGKFVVIQGNELDNVVTEDNASPSIKARGVSVMVQVLEDNLDFVVV